MRRTATLMFMCLLTVQVSAAPTPDRFERYFEKYKASGYRNCGRAGIGGANRAAVDACVLEAFAAGKRFFALYDQQGIDSTIAQGLLFTEMKVLQLVTFDDLVCANPYCAHSETCNAPRITKTKKGIHVQCTNDYDP